MTLNPLVGSVQTFDWAGQKKKNPKLSNCQQQRLKPGHCLLPLMSWCTGAQVSTCDTQPAGSRYKTLLGFPSGAEILRGVLRSCRGSSV